MSEENKDRIIQDFATNLIRLGNECRDHALENKRLKAEVERLIEAGDAIYQSFDQFGQVDAMTLKGWQAAKGGKQS